MSYDRIESMLNGTSGGFSPTKEKVPDEVMAERLFGAEPSVMDEDPDDAPAVEVAPERAAEAAEPEAERPDEDDLECLREAGWEESELKTITRDAAQRHALREMRRGKSERTAAPVEGSEPDELEATLAEELGKGTAKKVAPYLAEQRNRIAALERSVLAQRDERVVAELVGAYPELQRPAVKETVRALAEQLARPGDSPSKAAQRALKELYGTRSPKQSPADRAEARAQVDSQVSGSTRTTKQNSVSKDEAAYAAFRQFEKTGSVSGAIDVRKRLGH